MEESHKLTSQQTDVKTVLPDVVHSQQNLSHEGLINEASSTSIDHGTESEMLPQNIINVSESESISEHIPSKLDFSASDSYKAQVSPFLLLEHDSEKISANNSLNLPLPQSSATDNNLTQDVSKHTASSPLDINAVSDMHYLSDESAEINVPPLDQSNQQDSIQSLPKSPDRTDNVLESPRSKYQDSLNEEAESNKSELSLGVCDSIEISENLSNKDENSDKKNSSSSEDIIKLDIRGQGVPKYSMMATDIIFGPPPEGVNTLETNVEAMPLFQTLLSPFLVSSKDSFGENKVRNVFEDSSTQTKRESPQKSGDSSEKHSLSSDKIEQSDLLVEEVVVDCEATQTTAHISKNEELCDILSPSMQTLPKSFATETAPETMSFSTLTTDYKTICEEYYTKLVHLEEAITSRDRLIEDLTISLQQSTQEHEQLKHENAYLTSEIQTLQHLVSEKSQSDNDTVKAQLSDFVRYQTLMKDDSTKFYSALMSGGSSLQSSNGEKDMEREEITVNYSRSDLRTSESSDDFQFGFETKITLLMNKFDEYIQENMRNKLRESIIQILCDEIGKMKLEFDTEIKDLESQMQQDKKAFTIETRRLRELLSSVKTDSVEVEDLRKELDIKHEKEMENLRMYFEKKCSDMERSYSEDIYRGRKCASPLSDVSGVAGGAGGDYRRSRSAEPTSLVLESTPQEQTLKQLSKRYEQQIEEMRQEQLLQVQEIREKYQQTIAGLEEKICKLKAQLQSTEGPDGNMLYQQDIDLELEKMANFEKRLNEVRQKVRQEVVQDLQEKLQVLLSDPDAEVSSWPVELVALRDKIYGEQEHQLSGVHEGEDKWRQRRNNSFDQNRQLELVTKERDGFRRVASQLQCAVSQLVSYCAHADEELNNTVLHCLISPLFEPDSRSTSPEVNCKRVHFAPSLEAAPELELEAVLDSQRDLSVEVRRDLAISLHRLKQDARALYELSMKRAGNESRVLDSSQLQITQLVEEIEARQSSRCDNCELLKQNMLDTERAALLRENELRSQLEAVALKISPLMPDNEVIAEGYGCAAVSGDRSPSSPTSPHSRDHYNNVIDVLTREREDLMQQLEAANRQLRSTRQFVEEQAAEREAERDDYTRQINVLKQDNQRLTARLQSNARILSEMQALRATEPSNVCKKYIEQLETQAREMNQLIADLETKKTCVDKDLQASEEKVTLLRDIILNLEQQLEKKNNHEAEILKELQEMKHTIDDRDSKIRNVLSELEELRKERAEQSDMICIKCGQDDDKYNDLMEKVTEQCRYLEEALHHQSMRLERVHETCSASCSEHTEDVSIREQQMGTPTSPLLSRPTHSSFTGVWNTMESLVRASTVVFKRVADLEMQRAQLKQVAQEVRAERDVLQARMSEQALKISSLSARLDRQRAHATALASDARAQLSLELHDAASEVQRLKEEVECKDKQLARFKQKLEEKEKENKSGSHQSIYGNTCNPKDKVIVLERELSNAQTRIAQLEALVNSLESDKEELLVQVRELQRNLAERDEQMNELMALKLEDEQKENNDVIDMGKTSARTLSDIVSISDFDEQDLQMRRAELKAHNLNLSGAPFVNDSRDKTHLNRTMPLDLHRPNMSSLNLDYGDNFDVQSYTPRADSLPAHLTSTQKKDLLREYKRNINETTAFGNIDKFGDSIKHSTAQNIAENCSIYPNRDISDNKNVTIEPKKINFSLEPSRDNKYEDEFMSLRELGVSLDPGQGNFPDILSQLKHEIKKSRTELEQCKSHLKNAEEQLCEFPALKEEVEELKGLLENTMATMENDKKFYETQLENFTSNKKNLEQRLSELTQEVNDKSNDLQLLKKDILRRENMILELAKEKRNLTNKVSELEFKIDDLENLNTKLENHETENLQMKEKLTELAKLEQLVSEKNQQIDSLNQHLDRLDDMQRTLNDKTDEMDQLKEELQNKSNEVFKLLETVKALKEDISKINEDNTDLNTVNKDLKQQLTKLEKEHENASLKLQSNEGELSRLNSLNNEMSSKIDELKLLTDKLKDKETEIEILNEDINSYHEEIATLKDQLKMVSRSPSPRNKGDEKRKEDRQASSDKKQLVKIRKQISLLQHELDFNKKELNDKAFELAKAKLDVTELRNNLSQANKQTSDKEEELIITNREIEKIKAELEEAKRSKIRAEEQLEVVVQRLREEANVEELRAKLQEKEERCQELELQLQDMKEAFERMGPVPLENAVLSLGRRSPTTELELALRHQINYSHSLDHQIMEQILSASSDEHEDIPRLALGSSKSSSSIQSSSSERINRLRNENSKLLMQVNNLEARLKDKDALITELNAVRDKLVQDWQSATLRLDAERNLTSRLKLQMQKHSQTQDSLHNQDANMIQILKKRLESAMQSEMEAREKETELRSIISRLQGEIGTVVSPVKMQPDSPELSSSVSLLRAKLQLERNKLEQTERDLVTTKEQFARQIAAIRETNDDLMNQLAKTKRQRQESCLELLRAKELLNKQSATITQLQNNLQTVSDTRSPIAEALTEIECHKTELTREIASLKQYLSQAAASPELRGSLTPQQRDKDQVIRYLHSRCLCLESARKALVWQKRYLTKVLEGYVTLERELRLPGTDQPRSTGRTRFRCIATVVIVVLRMGFFVRKRQSVRAVSVNCILSVNKDMRGTPTPRGEVAQAYMNKLNLVSRCLSRTMDTARDVPGPPC